MKKILILLLALMLVGSMFGCGSTRIVTCDKCGDPIEIPADSNITDDWIVFCDNCDDFDVVS